MPRNEFINTTPFFFRQTTLGHVKETNEWSNGNEGGVALQGNKRGIPTTLTTASRGFFSRRGRLLYYTLLFRC